MRAVIFANGDLSHPDAARAALREDDLVIAADGGYNHCIDLQLKPTVLIGDFDSLDLDQLSPIQKSDVIPIQHPKRKDETDLELALLYARDMGAEEVIVFGALGARWDMTMANLLLLAHPSLEGSRISLIDGPQEVLLLTKGERLELRGNPGDTVSLIPLDGDTRGITSWGLEYPLDKDILRFGTTRGISNVLINDTAWIDLEAGLLLCVIIHQNQDSL
jgi:thiamine pyrophosphokinase